MMILIFWGTQVKWLLRMILNLMRRALSNRMIIAGNFAINIPIIIMWSTTWHNIFKWIDECCFYWRNLENNSELCLCCNIKCCIFIDSKLIRQNLTIFWKGSCLIYILRGYKLFNGKSLYLSVSSVVIWQFT